MIKRMYLLHKTIHNKVMSDINPYLRRLVRLLALPYCYLFLIDWHECTRSKLSVLKDLLYIFFVLKYYPDNYGRCRLWEKDRSQWKYYYGSIYDPYQRKALSRMIQRKEYVIVFEDKYICNELCKAASIPLPISYGIVEPNTDYESKLTSILRAVSPRSIIIKPLLGSGGDGIAIVRDMSGHIVVNIDNEEVSLRNFKLNEPSFVQEYIDQVPEVSQFSSSTNTVRIVTLLTSNGDVIILGSMMRFGVNNSLIDNTSRGGIAVGINSSNGTLMNEAYNIRGNIFEKHPDSGLPFHGFRLPYWKETVQLAERIQRYFFFYKMLCCDFGLSPHGPLVIELNARHDNVGLEQKVGPLLLNPRTLYEFRTYGLLVNQPTNNIAVDHVTQRSL